jgi:hypothetical protein
MTSENKTKIFIWLLAAIVVLAFAMRFPYLSVSALCDDEAFTVYYSSRPLSPWKDFLWGSMGRNGFPPLDFILHHFVFAVFGISAATARYVPTFFDTLTVFLLGLLGFRLANRKVGLLAALFWALSPGVIYYAKESRIYAQFGFAVTLYLFSLSLYIKKYSWQRLLFVFLSLLYGFNVSTLFAFVMVPAPLAVLLYYSTEFFKKEKEKAQIALRDISLLIATHVVGAFSVYGFYKLYSVPSASYFKVKNIPEMYSIVALWEKFIARIEQCLTVAHEASWISRNGNVVYFALIPLVLLLFSLIKWKERTFLKALIFCFLISIPIYDVITLYYGGHFSGGTHIRHIYFIVPVFCLGIAYSYDILFNLAKIIFDKLFKSQKTKLSYLLSLAVILLVFGSFDLYAQASLRKKVQNDIKSPFNVLYEWLNKFSAKGKVYVIDRVTDWTECRDLAYLCSIDYKHATNISYVIPPKNVRGGFNTPPPSAYNLTEDQLIDVIVNKAELAYLYASSYKFPYDKALFDVKPMNSVILYRMKPVPDAMTEKQYQGYSNIFQRVFTQNWHGNIHQKHYNLISLNPNFINDHDKWEYWRLSDETGKKIISCQKDESSPFVRIDNQSGKLLGLIQSVKVKTGSVYRISAECRIPEENTSLNGGRVFVNIPGFKEYQLTFITESHDWIKKELIFTNRVTVTASFATHTGYGNYKGKTDFRNVRLEEVKIE